MLTRIFHLPLTIVAMAEANPDVNRRRREMRDRLGVETIEVRKSLDTRSRFAVASATTASSPC